MMTWKGRFLEVRAREDLCGGPPYTGSECPMGPPRYPFAGGLLSDSLRWAHGVGGSCCLLKARGRGGELVVVVQ